MTKLEMDIIALLKEDARFDAKTMASMLNAAESEVANIIDQLVSSGVIVKYTTVIDDEKLDDGTVEALIEVRVTPGGKTGFDSIAEELTQHSEVKNLYLMSGAYDLCIIIEGKTLREIANFVSDKLSVLSGVLSTATHFILKKYKIEGVNIAQGEIERQLVHA